MSGFTFFLRKHLFVIILLILSALIFFTNLDGQGYSLDEPETVALSRSIFVHGFPSPWDGKNLVSTNNGKDIISLNGNYFWQWQPWMQHYLVFFGIKILGDNIFAQRFFFVLFGIGTIFLTYLASKELFKNKYVPLIISIHLILLLPFFLYVRSARYYSPSIFFSFLNFYLLILNNKGKWNKKRSMYFFFSNSLLFFSNYIVWLTTSIFILFSYFFKKNKSIMLVLITQIFIAAAWFIIFKPYAGNALVFNQLSNFPANILKNISYINTFIFPVVLVPFMFFLKKDRKVFYLILLLVAIKLIIYSIFLIPHGRYLADLFPILILIYGYFYERFFVKKTLLVLFLLFLIATFTNLLNISPYVLFAKDKLNFNFWSQKYYVELTGRYETVISQIGEYLKDKYKKGDLFLSNGYQWYVYDYSGVPSVSPVCDKKSNKFLGPSQITDKNKVRWIIMFSLGNDYDFPCFGFKSLQDMEKQYELIKLNFAKNTRAVNDVDIFNRQFPPVEIRPNEVYLFEKIR
jgi:hypothetical protein